MAEFGQGDGSSFDLDKTSRDLDEKPRSNGLYARA